MKEIKAFIHGNRVADVVHALKIAGLDRVSVIEVKGTLRALGPQEQEYSIELGEKVITEIKLELVCEDTELDTAITAIRENAKTGQTNAGWIYVNEILASYVIDDS